METLMDSTQYLNNIANAIRDAFDAGVPEFVIRDEIENIMDEKANLHQILRDK